MLNSIEAAVSTLEDAGALFYEISQPGSLKLKGEAADVQSLLDKFTLDWEKLSPGIYKIEFSKSPNDKRSGLCFRVNKAGPAQGSPAQLAGFGDDRVGQLQQQISNLETARQLDAMERKHADELRDLKAKQGNGSMLGGLDGPTALAGLDKITNIITMVTGSKNTPAGPGIAGPAAPALAPDETALAAALESLQSTLTGPVLVETLAKLAAKGQHNPEALRKALGYIDLL